MRFLFVVHKNEEKAEQNSVLFHRLTLKERGLRPNGYFPLMRQPLYFDCVPGMAQVLRMKVPSRVFTAKCSEPQAENSNV